MGLGASLCGSAKKVSEPTSATCSPPSESRLPVWEVREKDTGQFQESIVAISSETEGVQEPICRLSVLSDASCVSVSDSLHVLHCLQAGGLSWWVNLPQLMFHFYILVFKVFYTKTLVWDSTINKISKDQVLHRKSLLIKVIKTPSAVLNI